MKKELNNHLNTYSALHLSMYTAYSVKKLEELTNELNEHKSVIIEMRDFLINKPKSNFLKKRPRHEDDYKYNNYLYSHYPEHFEIINNSAIYKSLNKDSQTFLFFNHSFGNNAKWRVFGDFSKSLSVGVCMKEIVTGPNFKFTPMTHSSFLVSMNGYTWNCNNEAENYIKINLPLKEKNNSLDLEYSSSLSQLVFIMNSQRVTTLTNVFAKDNCTLVPCCVFYDDGEEIYAEIETRVYN
jgi:hypothetical protein